MWKPPTPGPLLAKKRTELPQPERDVAELRARWRIYQALTAPTSRPRFLVDLRDRMKGLEGYDSDQGFRSFLEQLTSSREIRFLFHVGDVAEIRGHHAFIGNYRLCFVCGCHDRDCRRCIERTGKPCSWVDPFHLICSACEREELLWKGGGR